MGKRMRRGYRSPSSSAVLSNPVLLRRIASSKLSSDPSSLNVDSVVHHLRSHYPDYARVKLQPFTLRVQRTLDSLRRRPAAAAGGSSSSSSSSSDDDDDDSGGDAPSSRKRPSRSNLSEQRLLRAESDHVRRRQLQWRDPSESSTRFLSLSLLSWWKRDQRVLRMRTSQDLRWSSNAVEARAPSTSSSPPRTHRPRRCSGLWRCWSPTRRCSRRSGRRWRRCGRRSPGSPSVPSSSARCGTRRR